jgi:hypothetical protein
MIMQRTLVIAALALGISMPALAQMQEGQYSGTYSAFGTAKATTIGKERLLTVWDENGVGLATKANGFLDHATWHCWGLGDFTNGMGQGHGYCVGTDPAGDQVVGTVADEKHTMDQKNVTGTFTFTMGTGKYAGVTGSGTFVEHGNEFRPTAEGTYPSNTTYQGSYKIPSPAVGSSTPPSTTPSK